MKFFNKNGLNKKLTKIITVLILFVTLFMNLSKTVYAGVLEGINSNGKEFVFSYNGTGVHTSQIVGILKTYYGYEGNELSEKMKLNTTATVSKVNNPIFGIGDTTYNVTVGTGDEATVLSGLSEEEVIEIFGEVPAEGDSCKVSVVANFAPSNGKDYNQIIDGNQYWIGKLTFDTIYSDEDLKEAEDIEDSSGSTLVETGSTKYERSRCNDLGWSRAR